MTIATIIRDAIYTRVTTQAFTWKSMRKIPVPPLQQGQTPALGVYLIRENYGPDGDTNTGAPRYLTDAVYGIMMMEESSKPEILEGSMDTLAGTILDTIMCDPTFFAITDQGGNPIIESVTGISRTYDFPKDGEVQYIQCRIQMTVRFGIIFPPNIANAFNEVIVTVQPPNQSNLAGVPPSYPANFIQEFETSPPAVAITTVGGFTNTPSFTVSGTAAQGSAAGTLGLVYLFDASQILPLGSATVSSGVWSIPITLTGLGEHNVYAVCADNLGNAGTSAPVTFTLVAGVA